MYIVKGGMFNRVWDVTHKLAHVQQPDSKILGKQNKYDMVQGYLQKV